MVIYFYCISWHNYQFYQEKLGQHDNCHFVEFGGHFSSCYLNREICAITSYYGNLKCHPFLWYGHPGNESSYWLRWTRITSLLMREWPTWEKLQSGNNVMIYIKIEFAKTCYVSLWWINRLILATSANLVIYFWWQTCVCGPIWRIHARKTTKIFWR